MSTVGKHIVGLMQKEAEGSSPPGKQDWATPQNFFDAVVARFGPFDIDLAATPDNTKCVQFINAETTDSLAPDVEWINSKHTTCWLNPPFKTISKWVGKAFIQAQKDPRATIIVMSRIAPSAKWWRKHVLMADEIVLLGGKRVNFVPPLPTNGEVINVSSNPQECCLSVFRHNSHRHYSFAENPEPYTHTWDWTKELSA